MSKILIIFLFCINLFASASEVVNNEPQKGTSVVKIIVWSGVGVGAVIIGVIYAPVVIPALIVTAKGTAAAVGAKAVAAGAAIKTGLIAAGPVAMTINTTINVARVGKDFVYTNSEQKLLLELNKESVELSKAKIDFEKCLTKYSDDRDVNSLNIPKACQESGMLFALLVQGQTS